MKEIIIGLIIAIVFVSLLTGIILYFNKNNTKKKKPGQKKTTTTPPNPQSTSKKNDWWKTLTNILWMLVALFLVIWIGIWIARGVKKLREPSPKPRTEKISEPVYQDDYFLKKGESVVIIYKKNYYYAKKYYGKIFYRQSFSRDGKVSEKILQGGNIPNKYFKNTEKEILSFYQEEGMISVFYSKDIKELKKIPD